MCQSQSKPVFLGIQFERHTGLSVSQGRYSDIPLVCTQRSDRDWNPLEQEHEQDWNPAYKCSNKSYFVLRRISRMDHIRTKSVHEVFQQNHQNVYLYLFHVSFVPRMSTHSRFSNTFGLESYHNTSPRMRFSSDSSAGKPHEVVQKCWKICCVLTNHFFCKLGSSVEHEQELAVERELAQRLCAIDVLFVSGRKSTT